MINSIDLTSIPRDDVNAPHSHQIRTDGALTSKSILHVIKGNLLLDQILHIDGKSFWHNIFDKSIRTTVHKGTVTSRRGQNQRRRQAEMKARGTRLNWRKSSVSSRVWGEAPCVVRVLLAQGTSVCSQVL